MQLVSYSLCYLCCNVSSASGSATEEEALTLMCQDIDVAMQVTLTVNRGETESCSLTAPTCLLKL